METRNIFSNLSPLDHRYYLSNRELFENLSKYLSEDASIRYCVKAEIALIKTHLSLRNKASEILFKDLDSLEDKIESEAVYKEEEKTRHNIRALVNVIKEHIKEEYSPLVHLGATSVDILDTAFALRIKESVSKVILPLLKETELVLCALTKKEAFTPQVGRTHGQHAVPITFGFALSEYVARLGKSIIAIKELNSKLSGKLSGAVGAYNALSMIYSDPFKAEALYMEFLGLKVSEYSNQLVEPEYILRLLLEINVAFGIIANLADDLRNLQRSEIDEVREYFSETQVGSSTMPQKRNPWNCEHVKSLWKTFSPRVMTFYMDQISEHQRDLTNSASQRFVGEFIAGFASAVARMKSILESLSVNREKMLIHLNASSGGVLAEPAYILLAECGVADAHEVLRKLTLLQDQKHLTLFEALSQEPLLLKSIDQKLKELGHESAEDFFNNPILYNGRAGLKATNLSDNYTKLMEDLL